MVTQEDEEEMQRLLTNFGDTLKDKQGVKSEVLLMAGAKIAIVVAMSSGSRLFI